MGTNAMVWAAGGVALWLAFAFACHRLQRNPRGTVDAGFLLFVGGVYARLVHRLRVRGLENVPAAGPLIVVSNHTAGIDPLLIQLALPFEVRWMMALDMQIAVIEPFWRWARVIGVKREQGGGKPDATGIREAIAHLKHAGVLGIFPEGGIERPAGRLMPFLPGVGVLAGRAGVPILPVIIRGTPVTRSAWGSLYTPSRAVVEFLPVVKFPARSDPEQVARELQAVMARAMA